MVKRGKKTVLENINISADHEDLLTTRIRIAHIRVNIRLLSSYGQAVFQVQRAGGAVFGVIGGAQGHEILAQELDLEMKKKTVQKTAVVYTAEETEDRKVAVMA